MIATVFCSVKRLERSVVAQFDYFKALS
jgi:hypothetical protein